MIGARDARPDGYPSRGPRGRGRGIADQVTTDEKEATVGTMTAEVKDELSRLVVHSFSARQAEVATILRFAGGLQVLDGRVVVSAELDTYAAARRLRKDIHDLYGYSAAVHPLAADATHKHTRHLVRVVHQGEALARRIGLVDRKGRVVLGLPPDIVRGNLADAQAAWRGAFLACGTLHEPGRANAMDIICPGTESALALVGAARRLAVPTKPREVRGTDRVGIREEAVAVMLDRMGARDSLLTWQERHTRQEARAEETRLANFDNANLRRSARAAAATIARVERALEILGSGAPEHLASTGRLRVVHSQAPLEELGRLADPPLTKDAVAGRIRRLLAAADRRAVEQGIPGTEVLEGADDADDYGDDLGAVDGDR